MKKSKIKFANFKSEVNFKKSVCGSKLIIDIEHAHSHNSERGKSTMLIECPCCGYLSIAYIWSFYGCGKRCFHCNVLMGMLGVILHVGEIDNSILDVSKDKLIKK